MFHKRLEHPPTYDSVIRREAKDLPSFQTAVKGLPSFHTAVKDLPSFQTAVKDPPSFQSEVKINNTVPTAIIPAINYSKNTTSMASPSLDNLRSSFTVALEASRPNTLQIPTRPTASNKIPCPVFWEFPNQMKRCNKMAASRQTQHTVVKSSRGSEFLV